MLQVLQGRIYTQCIGKKDVFFKKELSAPFLSLLIVWTILKLNNIHLTVWGFFDGYIYLPSCTAVNSEHHVYLVN